MKRILISAFLIGFWGVSLGYAHEDMDIAVSKAWVRALPATQTTAAAYMTIENKGKDKEVLVSVVTPAASAAEIHQMSEGNGMMKMAMLKNLTIPAGGKVTLEPGGYHLMLINLVKPLKKGDVIPIYLKFDCNCTITVKAKVEDGLDQENDTSMKTMSGMGSMPGMKM